MIGVDILVDIADKFGAIQAVRSKLIKQPDPAADKLVAALEEVSKIYTAIESELSRYLAISFDATEAAEDRKQERAGLIELEGGEIKARMGKARGHCKKILNIYHQFLSPWFHNVLYPHEADMMRDLFLSLDEFDGQMLNAVDQLADWLADEAQATLDLVDEGKFEEANQRVRRARKQIFPQRRAISDAMRTLLDLQAEFIGVSGAV
jgi:hypothetical protein